MHASFVKFTRTIKGNASPSPVLCNSVLEAQQVCTIELLEAPINGTTPTDKRQQSKSKTAVKKVDDQDRTVLVN